MAAQAMTEAAPSDTVAPPTPGTDYMPFAPPESPAPYVAFSSQNASPEEGVFVSADEVMALREWAEDREALKERLSQMERLAAAREEEMVSLRAQLDGRESDAAPVVPRLPLKEMKAPRRSSAENNALATQRQNDVIAKKQAHTAELREQWRRLRTARAAATARPRQTSAENAAAPAPGTPTWLRTAANEVGISTPHLDDIC